jgi:inner membrane protein involved in colicin E2 resistance
MSSQPLTPRDAALRIIYSIKKAMASHFQNSPFEDVETASNAVDMAEAQIVVAIADAREAWRKNKALVDGETIDKARALIRQIQAEGGKGYKVHGLADELCIALNEDLLEAGREPARLCANQPKRTEGIA